MTLPLPGPLPKTACYHCGEACPPEPIVAHDKAFCCEGCRSVYEILADGDLCQYYSLADQPGIRLPNVPDQTRFAYLDQTEVQQQLLDFSQEQLAKVTFSLPQIHCTSCVWLLEHLYRLHEGVLSSSVNFLRREVYLSYQPEILSLRELVQLMSSLGYEPEIRLTGKERSDKGSKERKALAFRLGVAGFCFGNIMLLSFPEYLGLADDWAGESFGRFFGYLNLLLTLPVLLYSSQSFFLPAWQGLKHRVLNLDVPISLGILALFSRSLYEILSHTGAGYLDSLAGLVFLLLVGKWVQRRTYDSLAFDRDYRSYFPLTATVLRAAGEAQVLVSELEPGEELLVRNQDLIPADAVLLSDQAHIDYSFVSGESVPVVQKSGDHLFAGGRQIGTAIRIQLEKAASQSYLTRLWEHDAFQQPESESLVDRMSRVFTVAVLSLASLAGAFWWWQAGIGQAVLVFTAVLIVACPCGLALSSPIILGNAMRVLGRHGWYLKSSGVIERLARLTQLVFDKTGTMTQASQRPEWAEDPDISLEETNAIASLAWQSAHPMSKALVQQFSQAQRLAVAAFEEVPGNGIAGRVGGENWRIGRYEYVMQEPAPLDKQGGTWVGHESGKTFHFVSQQQLRPGLSTVLKDLRPRYQLSVLSGDRSEGQEIIRAAVPTDTPLHFGQSPADKLTYIESLQAAGEQVAMIGDGLNDAGALRQSQVGIAITESSDAFSPACDVIMEATALPQLNDFLHYSRQSMQLLRLGWLISLAYNLIGLAFAVQGLLTPLVAAILMPLSSLTVVAFGLLGTQWLANRSLSNDKSHSLF